eukprot:CAMPEP_0115217474 /NCGR_PEP_ID=MMETSP0270-20121206/25881_1 /TAXON_ID=71861 /ORGANISM="Scrippsiella trochoidea, Strain CCMP3099" /LENGTH=50 /DNA_ID=CAMNT_0002631361 /DNA_START=79 /DNA_END=228 /DNA_ORIENTATION=+
MTWLPNQGFDNATYTKTHQAKEEALARSNNNAVDHVTNNELAQGHAHLHA